MRSGLGLPQGRGRPCHAQSTTGTVGGATDLRVRQKDHLAVKNNIYFVFIKLYLDIMNGIDKS